MLKLIRNVTGLRLFLQMRQLSFSLVNQKKSGGKKMKLLKWVHLNNLLRLISGDVFQKKDLDRFIALETILMLINYVIYISTPCYLLLQPFLVKIMISGFYKKTMILNIYLERLKNGKLVIKSIDSLGHHRVLI